MPYTTDAFQFSQNHVQCHHTTFYKNHLPILFMYYVMINYKITVERSLNPHTLLL